MSIFDEIDHIVNLDIKRRGVDKLYHAAYVASKNTPLCKNSAELIINSLKKDEYVLLSSGFPIIPEIRAKTDGPLGASIMAYVINELGSTPLFVTDDLSKKVLSETSKSIGLDIEVECVPTDLKSAKGACQKIFKRYNPCALISIERPGADQIGRYHNMNGEDITRHVGCVDLLFNYAFQKGILTVGIGDGGNEIGMGNISGMLLDKVKEKPKITDICSIYSATRTTSLMISAVSNWGAYGILAAISLLKGRQFMHNSEIEEKMLKACVDAGAIDGITKKAELSVDGLPLDIHKHLVELLRFMVLRNIKDGA